MDSRRLMLFLAILSLADTVWSKGYQSQCRCYPGDGCWPSVHEFAAFNRSLDGRLIATVPLASPCHDDEFGPYDASVCKMLQQGWHEALTQYGPHGTIPLSKPCSSVLVMRIRPPSCHHTLPTGVVTRSYPGLNHA
jgi:hypothetical protein